MTDYTKHFIDHGYAKIAVEGELLKDVSHLYLDLCRYFALLIDDSATEVDAGRYAVFRSLLAENVVSAGLDQVFQQLLCEVSLSNRTLVGKLYDIGTRPMKLMSGEKLFYNAAIQESVRAFFASPQAQLLAKPSNGETLHIFPPGPENFKFNLPIHQDFPYLMQSPRQLTFWLNLTNNESRNAGGVRIFPGTHKHGVPFTHKGEYGHYAVETEKYPDFDRTAYFDSASSQFELYAVDSLTWHSSNRNTSLDSTRLTYIFRISDIGDARRVTFGLDAAHKDCPVFDDRDFQ